MFWIKFSIDTYSSYKKMILSSASSYTFNTHRRQGMTYICLYVAQSSSIQRHVKRDTHTHIKQPSSTIIDIAFVMDSEKAWITCVYYIFKFSIRCLCVCTWHTHTCETYAFFSTYDDDDDDGHQYRAYRYFIYYCLQSEWTHSLNKNIKVI